MYIIIHIFTSCVYTNTHNLLVVTTTNKQIHTHNTYVHTYTHVMCTYVYIRRSRENVALGFTSCYIFLSTAPRAIIPITYSQGCFN